LHSAWQKHVHYGQDLDIANVKEEVGDLFWYLNQMCQSIGLSFIEAMQSNRRKLTDKQKGRYKEGRFTEREAKEENRDRGLEAEAVRINKETLNELPIPAEELTKPIRKVSQSEMETVHQHEVDTSITSDHDDYRKLQREGKLPLPKGMTRAPTAGNPIICDSCSTPISDEMVRKIHDGELLTTKCPEPSCGRDFYAL
jgi:hypothetical protein